MVGDFWSQKAANSPCDIYDTKIRPALCGSMLSASTKTTWPSACASCARCAASTAPRGPWSRGWASFRSAAAVQLLRDLAVLSEAGCGGQIEACLRAEPDYLGNGCWLALHDLMERSSWYRLRTTQEMTMGASATWIRYRTAAI